MATIQQLQSLNKLYELFSASGSLEATVAAERIKKVRDRTEYIIRERAFLRDERRRVRLTAERIVAQNVALSRMASPEWVPDSFKISPADFRLSIDVGKMRFDITNQLLLRDSKSLFAIWKKKIEDLQAAMNQPYDLRSNLDQDDLRNLHGSGIDSIQMSKIVLVDNVFVVQVNRDWWLFRYIMSFLRDGTLPDDRALLALLYKEAVYFNLSELQRAVEDEKLHLRTPEEVKADVKWWRNLPSWLKEKEVVKVVEPPPAPKPEDWWKDTSYHGKKYLPLSSDPSKVIAATDLDALPSITGVWESLVPKKD